MTISDRKLCPWGGLPCDCDKFPWLVEGLVPIKCEIQMPEALLGIRKVSAEGLKRYKAYLKDLDKSKGGKVG